MGGFGDAHDHGQLAGLGDDDHPGYLNGVRHSAENHPHSALSGVTANQHHNEDHASRHRSGGADELIKAVRVSTGPILPTATVGVNVVWGTAFPNPNYTVTDGVTGGAGNLEAWSRSTKTALGLTQIVHNNSATDALSGTLELMAVAA